MGHGRVWGALGIALTLGAGACATSSEIERGAYAHLAKAQHAQANGDYWTAQREREAANRQFAKARSRAYDEATYWNGWY